VSDATDRAPLVTTAASVPLHRQLFLVLHDEIARGALAPGDPLPTEQSLGEQFGVSRITVRRALADLADLDLIERRKGVGSFVRHRETPVEDVPRNASYLEGLRRIDFETDVDVVELGMRNAPAAVSARLDSDGPLLNVLRVRRERRTREPLLITDAWLPAQLSTTLTTEKLLTTTLYDALKENGVTIERMEHEITAEVAGPRTAQLLDVAIGAAVLRVNRIAYADGTPHHYVSIAISPSRSRILMARTGVDGDPAEALAIAHDVDRQRYN
jgi:GntR family transcriptional regulator